MNLIKILEAKTNFTSKIIQNIISLLDDGNTIPFISRYRKELTNNASDENLRSFYEIYNYQKNLEKRKEDIIRILTEKGLLTAELKNEILSSETLTKLEDIYRPFKEKKNTRATQAKAKGLEVLAQILIETKLSKEDFENEANKYINLTGDKKTEVKTKQEAIDGACDIIAEIISDNGQLREEIRNIEEQKGNLKVKASKNFKKDSKYELYKDYSKNILKISSHGYLAICRGESEKELSVKIDFQLEIIQKKAFLKFVRQDANSSKIYLEEGIVDGLKRLLLPSIEREIRANKKEKSDIEAIKVFGTNIKNLLLGSPLKNINILGFDPAYRTGCKLAVLDKNGKFLYNTVIYPTPPLSKIEESKKILLSIIKKYNIGVIAIGNGTASRESEKFVRELIKQNNLTTKHIVVNEAGASVYSASKLANDEYPTLDVTVRGAISIASRVIDPLGEFVKIDPKSIGVGQYQHDVDQKLLKEKLDENIEDTVNSVGVDVNSSSYALLQYISGLSLKTAKSIVDFRNTKGEIITKKEIKKVPGIGPKSFNQAIGFLRISGAKEPLDMTGIHPETFNITYEILSKELNISKKNLTLPMIFEFDIEKKSKEIYEKYNIGYETLVDIFKELQRPGLDPREELDTDSFLDGVEDIKDLTEGMVLNGVVRNVTNFGAFIDIGLHSDGLVHISQMSNSFVSDPSSIVSLGDRVEVTVLSIDLERERVNLSMKK